MPKNQHVTPHRGGGWQVKGAGNGRATVVTSTQEKAIQVGKRLRRIKVLNCLFTTNGDKFEKEIRTVTTLIPLRDNQIQKGMLLRRCNIPTF